MKACAKNNALKTKYIHSIANTQADNDKSDMCQALIEFFNTTLSYTVLKYYDTSPTWSVYQ